jgi:hypothetical protein
MRAYCRATARLDRRCLKVEKEEEERGKAKEKSGREGGKGGDSFAGPQVSYAGGVKKKRKTLRQTGAPMRLVPVRSKRTVPMQGDRTSKTTSNSCDP